MNKLYKISHWTWELPQTLLGAAIMLITRNRQKDIVDYKTATLIWLYSNKDIMWGISLGKYILLDYHFGYKTVQHEYGHCRQSAMLGPLYLILIGIPSLIRAIYCLLTKKTNTWYYKGYPENWADKLGGVVK